ncbi:MAG: AraC family transcriptional regulator [Novosphingobium sp.]|nr:AraC family transcriptional regulator [Novosphingobium sp.]
MRFSTDGVSEEDRVAYSREVYGRAVCGLEIEPNAGTPFHADQALTALPDLYLLTGRHSGHKAIRTRPLMADGTDDIVFHWNTDAPGLAMQCGREEELAPGEATVFSTMEVGVNHFVQTTGFITLRMPMRLFGAMVPDVAGTFARRIPAGMPALRLLKSYVAGWQGGEQAATPGMARLFSNHVYDIVALILGASGDIAAQAGQGGLRAARLAAIRREIERSALDPAFSLAALALRIGVTPRYVQKLLTGEGTAFIREVADRRLEQALRLLQSPRHRSLSIAEIAYMCGFPNVKHFHGVFRSRYGATPGDMRAVAATAQQTPALAVMETER